LESWIRRRRFRNLFSYESTIVYLKGIGQNNL
jgi:hypothetical protein